MTTIFRHTLRRLRGQILGWGIAFGAVAFYLMVLYKPMVGQQAELVALMEAYGETMMAFFGGAMDFLSPAGYLEFSLFSYMPVIAGIFALLTGGGLLAVDEEKGTLDLLLAYPISRAALFWGRFLAFLVATVAILGCTWIGFVAGLPLVDWEIGALALLLPQLSLLVLLMFFGAVALLLSMVLPSRTAASSVTGGLLVLSYLISSLARVNARLERLNTFSPLKYYQGGHALEELNGTYFAGLLIAAVLCVMLAWWRFERRDIRVGGEGSWKLPLRHSF